MAKIYHGHRGFRPGKVSYERSERRLVHHVRPIEQQAHSGRSLPGGFRRQYGR
jgi:hypothetical protein